MQRFLIASDVAGKPNSLRILEQLVEQRRPDGVLFAGGILNGSAALPGERQKKMADFFDGLGKLGVFTALIPGAADAPLREFLRMAKGAEVHFPKLHAVHATPVEEGNLIVCGLGGNLSEREDFTEGSLSYSRASAEYFLRVLGRVKQPRKVLMFSVTPPGQLGSEGGNRICGDFIDSYHPLLCVVGGATERRGAQQIAHTLVVNPGRLSEGSAAWLDWTRDAGQQVEFLQH